MERSSRKSSFVLAGVLLVSGLQSGELASESPVVSVGGDGRLRYLADERGNRVPDFSHCGYAGGDEVIPDVPVRVIVKPSKGDDGPRIQSAIDYVSALERGADGFRGAVLLLPGRYEIRGQLTIAASGVVLRGSGMRGQGTLIAAGGADRRTLIRIAGRDDRTIATPGAHEVASEYVPVGAAALRLDGTAGIAVGDRILITRPSTEAWIKAIGMDGLDRRWKPGTRDLTWDRAVTAINDNTITVDAPITTAIESRFGGGRVRRYTWPGRIERIGVENLRLESTVDRGRRQDESHSWIAITMENAQDAWVRRVEFAHFPGSAVSLWGSVNRVTVEDCKSLDPVSEIGGYRRHTFFTMGQLTLFLRCWSEHGRRDFSAGHCAVGPNAFVACTARQAFGDSGPIESWASGVLYDNVLIDRGRLRLDNQWNGGQGAGWSAANCVIWQSSAAEMRCFAPPTAQNWAIGAWAGFAGDGHWESRNEFVTPRSLFLAQLADRVGEDRARRSGPIIEHPPGTTNPSVHEAAGMVEASNRPAPSLLELIDAAVDRDPITVDAVAAPLLEDLGEAGKLRQGAPSDAPVGARGDGRLEVTNGWLVVDGKLKTGGRIQPIEWGGSARPSEAPSYGPAITRFVPGRIGTGYTDDLDEVADGMVASGTAVLEHHHGLWYDRRRDDHERVRRLDGDVLPPFYELPFERTGLGSAWDGLSKYDLKTYNPWYWSRLRQFSKLCDERGLILLHQQYFQHNLLEAGAHWADFPWRSANNINNTGFPEPPPYAGDKRIFQAHLFYDPTHPIRRDLHRAYIRKCLENFTGISNVIQTTAAEFTGPVEFMEFWIDTVSEWQEETRQRVLIALSCTKDVQDRILDDPARASAVSIIDIRYWWYQSNGELYAPAGGQNLSPRQHARLQKPKRSSFEQTLRAVREYRMKFPEKAVIYSAPDEASPWAVLMGGGSLPRIGGKDLEWVSAAPKMRPAPGIVAGDHRWSLADPERAHILVYSADPGPIPVSLPGGEGTYLVRWIEPRTGDIILRGAAAAAGSLEFRGPGEGASILWLTRN